VYAFDSKGQAVSGDECDVQITPDAGGEEADVDIVDNGDGTYAVAYQVGSITESHSRLLITTFLPLL